MSRLSAFALGFGLCVSTSALADPPKGIPKLMGRYVFSSISYCVNPLSVTLGSGSWRFDGYDSIYINVRETDGTTINRVYGKSSYSVKLHHFFYDTRQFSAEYGDVENGVARHVSLIGLQKTKGGQSCSLQWTLIHK